MPSNDKPRRRKHAVRLTEINEKLAQIKAVLLCTKESVHTIKHFSIVQLRMLFKRKQSSVADQYQTAYDKGEFTRFPSDPATTLIIKQLQRTVQVPVKAATPTVTIVFVCSGTFS